MASNQVPVAEKARIISDTYVVSDESMDAILSKKESDCTEVELFIRKGNRKIPFDMVRQLQKKEIKDSTFEELKIRYNDPQLGKFPEWFDYKEVSTIIRKAVNQKWQDILAPVYDKDDLYSMCWEKILLESKKIREVGQENYQGFVYKIATNRITYNTFYYVDSLKHFRHDIGDTKRIEELYIHRQDEIHRLPEAVYNLNETDEDIRNEEKILYISSKGDLDEAAENSILDKMEEEMDILNIVKSISDTTTRDLICMAAYLIADIECFEDMYKEAVSRLDEEKYIELSKIIEDEDKRKLNFNKILKIIAGKNSKEYLSSISDYLCKITKTRKLAEI